MTEPRVDTLALNAFVDGELELDRQIELEARVAADPGLRAEVERLRSLRGALREHAEQHVAPPALRAWLQTTTAPPPVAAPAAAAWRRWFAWRPMLPAFALAAALGWGALLLRQPGADAALFEQVIASHVRSSVGERLVDVASSDQHTVKPWLSARLDFSPPVADQTLPGVSFVGGRVDYLAGRPVATLVYRKRQHVIEAYVWPTEQADATMHSLARRGFNGLHWDQGGMRYWVISDLNAAELRAFAQAVAEAR